MKAGRVACGLAVALVIGVAPEARADVKTEEKTLVRFEGMLGRMSRMFGGKAAKEGIVSTVAVKGDRQARLSDDTGQIIDLAEEKVYELDLKKKTYRVKTFEQLRLEYEAAMKKAESQMKEMQEAQKEAQQEPAASGDKPPEFETDFAVNETGQKKSILGYECKEVVSTVTVRQKGKTVEQGGGMVITTTTWLAPRIPPLQEVTDFEMRYAQKLMGPAGLARAQEQAEQLMMALAMYPGLQKAMERSKDEATKLDGTALVTISKIETVAGTEARGDQQAQKADEQKEEDAAPTSVGGLGGMLGRKMMKKKTQDQAQQNPQSAGGRTTMMTSTIEYLKIVTEASAADVTLPQGFRERGQPQ